VVNLETLFDIPIFPDTGMSEEFQKGLHGAAKAVAPTTAHAANIDVAAEIARTMFFIHPPPSSTQNETILFLMLSYADINTIHSQQYYLQYLKITNR